MECTLRGRADKEDLKIGRNYNREWFDFGDPK